MSMLVHLAMAQTKLRGESGSAYSEAQLVLSENVGILPVHCRAISGFGSELAVHELAENK